MGAYEKENNGVELLGEGRKTRRQKLENRKWKSEEAVAGPVL
jgi:hypothetical protein